MKHKELLALDYGSKRIGVARVSMEAKIPEPLEALIVDGEEMQSILNLIDEYHSDAVIVGWPRSLEGGITPQTNEVDDFIERLNGVGVETIKQDEALTSKKAEEELKARGKKYSKGEIDSLAAVYILEDYLKDNHEI